MPASLTLTKLQQAIHAAGITSPGELESRILKLSPSQSRLWELLQDGPADTIQVRTQASIGNISECAITLNKKLEAANDARRVLCHVAKHENRFGERGVLGLWYISEAA